MARRKVTGFNAEQLRWYRNLKAAGYTQSAIARISGSSHSSVGLVGHVYLRDGHLLATDRPVVAPQVGCHP